MKSATRTGCRCRCVVLIVVLMTDCFRLLRLCVNLMTRTVPPYVRFTSMIRLTRAKMPTLTKDGGVDIGGGGT